MIRVFLAALITLIALELVGCTDSDQYLFKPDGDKDVEVHAFIVHSFDQETEKCKQDTIVPGDSVIFQTNIYPSKSIRLQRYYWTIDEKLFASEFSFKNTVFEQGPHKIKFILIDYFGDQISDSLMLYVGIPPMLDYESIIPKDNTQGINPSSIINFAWKNLSNDSSWQVSYRFTLKKLGDQDPMIDTLLTEPHFSYHSGLAPLEKYFWDVSAVNELNMVSNRDIHATFYTAGYSNQGAITGHVSVVSATPSQQVTFSVVDSTSKVVQTFKNYTLADSGAFFLAPIPEGKYSLICSKDSSPDFTQDTATVFIKKTGIGEADFTLTDVIGPEIFSIARSDSLNAADSLRFIVRDGGCEMAINRITAYLENTFLTGIQYRGDTLVVPLPSKNYWTTQRLRITAQDASGNKVNAYFFVRPSTTIIEVLDD